MSPDVSALDRILRLSAFDGDSAAALRTLHAHFAARFPDCSLALVLVGGQGPGQCRLAGLIGPDGTEHVPNVDPFGERTTLPLFADALTGRLFAGNAPRVVRVAPTEFALPFAQAMLAPATLLGIPVVNTGEVRHWLVFGSTFHPRFDRVDLDALLLEINLAASLIVRPIATRALRDETDRQRREIEGIADVQRVLLPDDPAIRGLEYAVHWQPAETAAGDYYDLMSLTPFAPDDFVDEGADVWALMLADVSGHGASAAMEAVQFDAILRTYQGDGDGPAGALTYANKYFFSRRQRQHFLTAFALLYRPDLRRATYVAAGHPPLLQRRAGVVTQRAGYLHGLSLQDGSYKVADVPAGTVRILAIAAGINVKTQQPTKWYFTQQVKGHPDTDSDFTPKTDNVMHTLHFGEINKVQIEAGKDLVLDAGVIDPAKPANNGVACVRAWDDKNRNGLRDKGEAPIAGLPVDVSSEVESTQPATTKGTVKSLSRVITARGTVARKPGTKEDIPVTDAKGSYCFSDRRAGKYKALIGLGPVVYDANGTPDIAKIWTLTIHNAAGNTKDAIDSDFVLAGGKDIPARLAGKVGVSDKFKVKDDNTTVVDAGMWRNATTPTPSSSPAPPTPTPTTAPGGGGGPLPTTGAALTGILGAGVLLVGGGIAMTAFARRRRRTAA